MQFYSDTFKPFNHGRNLAGDTEDVAPTFSGCGYVICHVPQPFTFKRVIVFKQHENVLHRLLFLQSDNCIQFDKVKDINATGLPF